jgi:Helix-turn-helix domain
MTGTSDRGEVLTPCEAARMFNITVKTLTKWTLDGKLPKGAYFRNPGVLGHRRYYRRELEAIIDGRTTRRTS